MKFAVISAAGERVAIIDVNFGGTPAECLEAIKAGVTDWLNNTDAGKRIKEESDGEYTLQDLAESPNVFLSGTSLAAALYERGVKYMNIVFAGVDSELSNDGVTLESNLYQGEE